MARRLRYIPPEGALVEVTTRTIQSRLLLRPSPALNDVIGGVLARAARLFEVALHGHSFLSNHYHLLLSILNSQQLASFMNYVNSNLAREAGRLVQWRDRFWARRYQAILVSNEEEAQVGRLAYLLAQGVKEGLVASPYDWPGVHCASSLATGTPIVGRWRDRTLEFKARRSSAPLDSEGFFEHEELTLTPLPCWQDLEPEEHRARIQELIAEIEVAGKRLAEKAGRPPLGPAKVCRQDPHLVPKHTKKAPAPLVHAFAPEVRQALRRAYAIFFAAFRHAARLLRAGLGQVEFPEGAFPPALPVRFAARGG